MEQQQATPEQIEAFVLTNYVAKKEKGIISVEFDAGAQKAVLIHKQYNSLQEEIDPIKLHYTSSALRLGQINRRKQRDEIEIRLIQLQEQLRQFDADSDTILGALEADVRAAEEKAQPSNPKPDKNRHIED